MADPDGKDLPKPPPAAIPDLKKAAAEKKPDGVVWTPGVARASASVTIGVPPKPAPTLAERLKSPYGLAAALVLLLVAGGGLFSLTAFHVSESRGGSGGGLSGVGGSVKFRAVRGQDGVGFVKREAGDDARQDRMKVDTAGVDIPKVPEVKIPGAPGEAAGEGGGPMAYDTSGNSRAAGASGAIPGGGAGGSGGGDAGSGAGRTAPQLQGNVSFRGMRSVSGTAGFRGLKGGRAMLKSISGRGGSSKSSGGSASAEAADSSSVGGSLAGSGGSRPAGGAAKKDAGAAGAANPGGGGGGGGGDANFDDLQQPDDVSARIGSLMQAADDDYKKAEKDKKIAIALKATGNDLQAAYHYDRYQKEKAAGDKKKAEANQLTATMASQSQELADKAIKDAAAAGGSTGGSGTGGSNTGGSTGGTVISAPR